MNQPDPLPAAAETAAPPNDIESRQDEVLRQLSELLAQLEKTIREAQVDRAAVKRPAA